MGSNSLGSAGVQLYADTAQYQADMGKAAAVAEREMRRIQRESQMAAAIVTELGKRTSMMGSASQDAWTKHAGAATRARQEITQMARDQNAARVQAQQLNYQITDIVTGLATGQRPLYVLMQQGGQLRDLYGGVGAAFAGVARGVVAMINPVTVAAAAVGAVAYAMYQGAEESREFQKQIALTGNFAAMTEASLRGMAEASSNVTGRAFGDSRQTVAALAGTGLFGPDALKEASRAMGDYQRLTGQTADEAVKNFQTIATGAAKWAAEQNRQVHFLTAEQYRHIKALEDTGHQQDAMREALRLMANELESRATPAVGNLEKAWRGVENWMSRAWAAMKNWGKPDEMADKIEKMRKAIADAETRRSTAAIATDPAAAANWDSRIEGMRERLRELLRYSGFEQDNRGDLASRAQSEADEINKLAGAHAKNSDAIEAEYQAMVRRTLLNASFNFRKYEAERIDATNKALAEQNAKLDEEARAREKLAESFMLQKAAESDARVAEMNRRQSSQGFSDGLEVGGRKWWEDAVDQQKVAEHLITNGLDRMADAFLEFTKTGKFNLRNLFEYMAQQWLLAQIKMQMTKLFFNTAGEFLGVGSGLGDFFGGGSGGGGGGGGGGGSFANGNPYVSRDGPAYLHEGERVLTRQENLAYSGGAGGRIVFQMGGNTYITGNGVSQAQVNATVEMGNRKSEARIRRLMSEGSLG